MSWNAEVRVASVIVLLAGLLALPLVAQAQVINELVANHTGTDNYEYVEIYGAPSTSYATLSVLVIEGDANSTRGTVDRTVAVGTTDANGIWFSGYLAESTLENGTITLLLVDGFSGALGADLDTDDDGTFNVTPWTALIDSVGVSDGGTDDRCYSAAVLLPGSDGNSNTWGGASRIPDGTDTDTAADWVRNDFDGAGLPGLTGSVGANEVANTPGTVNGAAPPPPPAVIDEVVADHVGADDYEYLEIHGQPGADYSPTRILVVEGDTDSNPGTIDAVIQPDTANGGGVWSTGFMSDVLEGDSFTVLLVTGFTGAVGDDLDTDDDGALDLEPWDEVMDDVAVADGDAGDRAYSTTVLGPGLGGLPGAPGGASRVPTGIDTDTVVDWVRNDFDGAGLDGFAGTLTADEAFNTPGMVNRVGLDAYYAAVDYSGQPALRATLHAAVDDHARFAYTSDSVDDTWTILEQADEDPADPGSILDVYKNESYLKVGGGNSNYNREHTWPNSYGFPDDGLDNYPYTDCHHLLLSDITYNSDRANLPYRTCDAACAEDGTVVNNGEGGGSGVYPGNSNWFTGTDSTGTWETWVGRRGDVARAVLYLDLRYAGGSHGVTGVAEPDLILTDEQGLIATSGGVNAATAYMGVLSVILQWHDQDPVDDLERSRNDVVWRYQGNRNPFIDHPEWVECVFLGTGCGVMGIFADDFERGDTTRWSTVVP